MVFFTWIFLLDFNFDFIFSFDLPFNNDGSVHFILSDRIILVGRKLNWDYKYEMHFNSLQRDVWNIRSMYAGIFAETAQMAVLTSFWVQFWKTQCGFLQEAYRGEGEWPSLKGGSEKGEYRSWMNCLTFCINVCPKERMRGCITCAFFEWHHEAKWAHNRTF